MKQKVVRIGSHSLAVIIPAHFTHALGIKAGDSVLVDTRMDTGRVNLQFSGTLQLPLLQSKKKKY